ncbi:MAG: HdeD family acid-resistance protein [Acidobacteria bacterium]|nr:MAG: HdeD family acid-resistance protein [Acidobacteriota bacterium]
MTPALFPAGFRELRRNWIWLFVLGILLIILGVVALIDSVTATVISMLFFGWVLLIAGIVEAVQAFRHRNGSHIFLHGMNAVLGIVVGLLLLRHPVAAAMVITLLLAVYFTVAGVFRIMSVLALRPPRWGWALADGIITFILGVLVWVRWPSSSLWIIGLFIGIDLIVVGWSEVMLASAVHQIPQE